MTQQNLDPRRDRAERVALVAGVMVVLGAVVAAAVWAGSGGEPDDGTDYSGIASSAGAASLKVGPADAPVKVVIYEDFLCAYCRQLEVSTRDFLQENAAKGNVQVEYQPVNHLVEHSYSARAMNAWAAVLTKAGPAAALKLRTLLFENQPVAQRADTITDGDLVDLVEKAGGATSEVVFALRSRDKAFFAASARSAGAVDLRGTPTVVINGDVLSDMSLDQMIATIEERVAAGS